MKWVITVMVAVSLSGCGSIYRSIHNNIWPIPDIQKEASIKLWRSDDRKRIDVGLEARVRNAETVAWFYYCLNGGSWSMVDEYPEIEGMQQDIKNTRVVGGVAHNVRKDVQCMSSLGIKIVARNNPGSRVGEKSSSLVWVVDIEDFITRHAASQIED